jgi:hypothetical protein
MVGAVGGVPVTVPAVAGTGDGAAAGEVGDIDPPVFVTIIVAVIVGVPVAALVGRGVTVAFGVAVSGWVEVARNVGDWVAITGTVTTVTGIWAVGAMVGRSAVSCGELQVDNIKANNPNMSRNQLRFIASSHCCRGHKHGRCLFEKSPRPNNSEPLRWLQTQ